MDQGSFPGWLHGLAILWLGIAAACAVTVALDELRRPQRMWIMNLVWPLTTLFGGLIWLFAYYRWGRESTGQGDRETPMAISVFKGASHCGAGCTLGDIIAEWLAFGVPAVAVWFGWHSLFAEKTFAVWIPDFLLAFLIGIFFQYWSIVPMRDLSPGEGIVQAVKADFLSITSWQVGMYGLMAAIQFGWFAHAYGGLAPVNSPEFWFAMQLAMLGGFCTSYPTNWALVRTGVKEAM